MNSWTPLRNGEVIPQLEPQQFVWVELSNGKIERLMFRFVKNLKCPIKNYLVEHVQRSQ